MIDSDSDESDSGEDIEEVGGIFFSGLSLFFVSRFSILQLLLKQSSCTEWL